VRDWIARTGGRCVGKAVVWTVEALTPPTTTAVKTTSKPAKPAKPAKVKPVKVKPAKVKLPKD
jgi:hypothetical protein